MKKLSGWMRIWIVLSVVFFISSYLYGVREYNQRNNEIFNLYRSSCEISNKSVNQFRECWDYAVEKTDESKKSTGGLLEPILVFSILPLSFFWIFGFISYRIFKWIRKGFVEQPQSTE